ncbi:MAG TPA: YHS domain-containing protein [Thermoanaerobaculia bacterium]|nr:YHS domain-containing protein [Thermoanaerobaculia bacterium]
MRRFAVLAVFALAACDSTPPQSAQATQFQTIHTAPAQPAPLPPPPVLSDEAPPPKPKPLHQWDIPEPIVFSPEDEKVRASLPFTPAIAMDPIDGSKLSIRAATPTLEYKGKIYYFSSEENRNTFKANPEAALKGGVMRL